MLLSQGSSRDGKTEGERSRKQHSTRQRPPHPSVYSTAMMNDGVSLVFNTSFSVYKEQVGNVQKLGVVTWIRLTGFKLWIVVWILFCLFFARAVIGLVVLKRVS